MKYRWIVEKVTSFSDLGDVYGKGIYLYSHI